MIGSNGLTANDCAQVANALDAVEMGRPPLMDANSEASLCPADQIATDVYAEGFEVPDPARWISTLIMGSGSWAHVPVYATNGDSAMGTGGASIASDFALSMVSQVAVPANAHLHFRHAFEQEFSGSGAGGSYYDGGVLRYSTNNGATWIDAGALYSAGKNYGGDLTPTIRSRAATRSSA